MRPDAITRAERILGTQAENWARVVSRGYSVNEHWTVGFADGSRAFLKLASVDPSPQWVRDERRVFECVAGSFMPLLLGFEDGDRPLLILEDMLPDARWPPPWQPGDIDAVLAALNEVASAPLSGELPRLAEDAVSGWKDVAEDPAPFLGLRIVTAEWLERSLPALLEASDPALLDGGSLAALRRAQRQPLPARRSRRVARLESRARRQPRVRRRLLAAEPRARGRARPGDLRRRRARRVRRRLLRGAREHCPRPRERRACAASSARSSRWRCRGRARRWSFL